MEDDEAWVDVVGKPVPFARPAGRGKRYTPREYAEWKNLAVTYMRLVKRVPELGDADVYADVVVEANRVRIRIGPRDELPPFWMPDGWGKRPKGVRGDLDNYVKAALDAAQDARWITDDRQVVLVRASFQTEPKEE